MSSHYLDFSSCGIVPGFCKSGQICTDIIVTYLYYSPSLLYSDANQTQRSELRNYEL